MFVQGLWRDFAEAAVGGAQDGSRLILEQRHNVFGPSSSAEILIHEIIMVPACPI